MLFGQKVIRGGRRRWTWYTRQDKGNGERGGVQGRVCGFGERSRLVRLGRDNGNGSQSVSELNIPFVSSINQILFIFQMRKFGENLRHPAIEE